MTSAFLLFFGLVQTGAAQIPSSSGLVQLSSRTWAWIASDENSSNGVLFRGDTAALLVDPGLTPERMEEFSAAARSVLDVPIRYIVLTHWHPDHAMGMTCTDHGDREVIAHPATRLALAERAAVIARQLVRGCRVTLPEHVVSSSLTVDLGSHVIRIFHPGPAHTKGDLVVWSAAEGTLAAGDLFMNGSSPSMGEGSTTGWITALDSLLALGPKRIVPGHFAAGDPTDVRLFRDYLASELHQVKALLARGVSPESVGARIVPGRFASFRQFPRFDATFAANAAAIARELTRLPAERGRNAGFAVSHILDVGKNPHQIAFRRDGSRAVVAAAGSDRLTVVDTRNHSVTGTIPFDSVPLGVAWLGDGSILATRFGANRAARLTESGSLTHTLRTGAGPSLLTGPLPNGTFLISVERAGRLLVIDADLDIVADYPAGDRPFPPAATSDGRLAFVPNYNDGTVTVVDLWNRRIIDTVVVGTHPSGGVVMPGDIEYAVAVRGDDRISFINTASHRVTHSIDNIGDSPFSVVLSTNGRLGFVNNTASHDVAVFDTRSERVIARIPVGEQPIVMGVHPSGGELWVSSEGSHELSVVTIPREWQAVDTTPRAAGRPARVAVMGMIHGRHRTSRAWGLNRVRETIRRFNPDAVCAEIPPDRWDRIWRDYAERGVIEDPRVLRFPEYVDLLLELKVEMGFEIIPCAGWTREMSDLRQRRIREFRTEPRWAKERTAYDSLLQAVQARYEIPLDSIDDPLVIHSSAYDERMREELSLYDRYMNDMIGPGGWTNINEAHMRLIDRAISTHRGKRILITFGAGHKYWFLDRLRKRDDIDLVDLRALIAE